MNSIFWTISFAPMRTVRFTSKEMIPAGNNLNKSQTFGCWNYINFLFLVVFIMQVEV